MRGNTRQGLATVRLGGTNADLSRLLQSIRQQIGVDFTHYKRSRIRRHLARRLLRLNIKDLHRYATYLESHSNEAKALSSAILDHATVFFRDPIAFDNLKQDILPKCLENRDPRIPFRVWVPACSSGEEVYSIAIVLLECLDNTNAQIPLQIFGSSTSEGTLQIARSAIYPESAVRNVSQVRLNRFFKNEDGRYHIERKVREQCTFSRHNIASDPPFAKMDLICCRNLLIFFTTPQQQRVMRNLHYSLNPGGILWLGRSKTIKSLGHFLSWEDNTNKPKPSRSDVQIKKYVPPAVVINGSAEILQIRGKPAPFLKSSAGLTGVNFFQAVHPGILPVVRHLIDSASKKNTSVRKKGLVIDESGERWSVGIRVVPVRLDGSPEHRYFSIFFEESLRHSQTAVPVPEYVTKRDDLIASNEALQSMNEELQCANEELEVTSDELQTANEQLVSVNEKLQSRTADMTQLTNDLTNLLASVDIPIVMLGPDSKIRRFTPNASKLLNLISTDIGRPIGDIKPSIQTPESLNEMVAQVMASLKSREVEVPDRQGGWYQLRVRPYQTSDDHIEGAVLALTDISALKRTAEELKIAHDDAIKIIETMPSPILIISPDLRVQAANHSFYRMFRVQPEVTEHRHVSELCEGYWDIPSLLAKLQTVLTDGTTFRDFELEQDFPVIGRKFMVLHATATRLSGTNSNTALLAIEDVTARQQASDRFRHEEQKYRDLLENAHDGVLIVNRQGIIEFANQRLESMFGYSAGELQSQSYEALIPENYRENHRSHHDTFMQQPEPRGKGRTINNLSGRRKDGSEFAVEISLSPVKVNSEVMVTAFVRDISERTKMEAERQNLLTRETDARLEAEKASRIKDEFLATLSHELRTPLTSILAWSQILQSDTLDAPQSQHALAVIERNAKDQSLLIDDLLDVSRIRAGKMLLDLRRIEPNSCIARTVESVQSVAENKSLAIETDLDSSACSITADSSRLQQVFRNLLTNAIKFTMPGGKITVRSRRQKNPDRLEIQVEDTGKGINPDFLPSLFNRFRQEDSSTTREFGGLGLGLSIVRNLVEMHGGTVKADSAGEGKGAVFTVTLPCAGPRITRRRNLGHPERNN